MLNYILDKLTGDIIAHSGPAPDSDRNVSSPINGNSVSVRNYSSNFFFNIFDSNNVVIFADSISYDDRYITFNFSEDVVGTLNIYFVGSLQEIIQITNTPTPTPTSSVTPTPSVTPTII